MKVLGIDPGLRRTGFGIIEVQGSQVTYITSGTIVIPTEQTLANRLKDIAQYITEIIKQFQPTESSIEKVFVNNNPQSTLLLGHARGAAMTALALNHLEVTEYTALQIKKAVVGRGHAQKEQVQTMVQHLLKLNDLPSSDSADALACAICHAHAAPLSQKLIKDKNTTLTIKTRLRGGRLIS